MTRQGGGTERQKHTRISQTQIVTYSEDVEPKQSRSVELEVREIHRVSRDALLQVNRPLLPPALSPVFSLAPLSHQQHCWANRHLIH